MTVLKQDTNLDDIRREIDAIDDAILYLLIRRFAATAKVRATKSTDGTLATSPLRPAREATMLRRLMDKGGNQLPPQLLVRLWRVILSASTQSQAPITVHVPRAVAETIDLRLGIAEHFNGMRVEPHDSIEAAFRALAENRGDLAVVATDTRWADVFAASADEGLRLVSCLPAAGNTTVPELLVFGHAEPQPSGDDETIFLTRSPVDLAGTGRPIWQVHSGGWWVTSRPGFLTADRPSADAASRPDPDIRVAGRYPRPIEVLS
ncbi:chorismate mutase [Aestuariivirga sp.]|uniref:chorismate mutase n=1 Tax=Aestuariivirga sp. TaxID=2650926 RepID=UPI003593ED37